jgi:hypothetical protein
MKQENNTAHPAEQDLRAGLIQKFEEVGYTCQCQAQETFTVLVFRPRVERKEEETKKTG